MEKCLVGGGRRREFWWDPEVFSPGPPNTQSPQIGENERKLCKTFWTKMPMSMPIVYVLVPFSSYSFF